MIVQYKFFPFTAIPVISLLVDCLYLPVYLFLYHYPCDQQGIAMSVRSMQAVWQVYWLIIFPFLSQYEPPEKPEPEKPVEKKKVGGDAGLAEFQRIRSKIYSNIPNNEKSWPPGQPPDSFHSWFLRSTVLLDDMSIHPSTWNIDLPQLALRVIQQGWE